MKETNVFATAKRLCGIVLAVVIALALAACSSDGGTTTIIENDYDPNNLTIYTVTFDSDGGSALEPMQVVVDVSLGKKMTSPFPTPVKFGLSTGFYAGTAPGYTFDGWEKPDGSKWDYDTDKIKSDIKLKAKWVFEAGTPIDLSSPSLGGDNIIVKSINYIIQTSEYTNHTLVLDTDLSVATITYDAGKTLTITSNDATPRIITKNATNGSVFIVTGNGTKLVIDGYVTLQGKTGNNAAVVQVTGNGKLDLKGYAKITGNTKNTTTNSDGGGGIHCNGGIITMDENALISGNTVAGSGSSPITVWGGGVWIASGSFTMKGGEISGNTVLNDSRNSWNNTRGNAYGGGVFIGGTPNAVFAVLNDTVKASIKNNTTAIPTTGSGGGTNGAQVYKDTNGVFTVGDVPAVTF